MAQFGSAREWGSRGRKFKSSYPDHREQVDKACSFYFFEAFLFRLKREIKHSAPITKVSAASKRYHIL